MGLTANKKVAFADFCVLQPEGSQAERESASAGRATSNEKHPDEQEDNIAY